MINGGTGPVLAFSGVLYSLSKSLDVPFLTFNAWVGLWVAIYLCIAAFFDLNIIIHYATRFTDEVFALLISMIFIINALGNPFAPVGIYYYFEEDHKSHDKYEDQEDYSYKATAFLSLILCLGTVAFALFLKQIKFSPYGPNQLTRNVVHDFSVVASILIMSIIGNVLFSGVQTETLNVPDTFAPTYACCTAECNSNWPVDCEGQAEPFGRRPWLVDLADLNGKPWVAIMAAGPALLAFILVFLDDGITWHRELWEKTDGNKCQICKLTEVSFPCYTPNDISPSVCSTFFIFSYSHQPSFSQAEARRCLQLRHCDYRSNDRH